MQERALVDRGIELHGWTKARRQVYPSWHRIVLAMDWQRRSRDAQRIAVALGEGPERMRMARLPGKRNPQRMTKPRKASADERKAAAKIKRADIQDAQRQAWKDVPAARAAFASKRKTTKGAKGPIPDDES